MHERNMKAIRVITRLVRVIQKSSLKHWIPAFAGMTETRGEAIMKKLTLVVGIILASVISAVCAENNAPEFLYQKGLYLETAKADYEGAVKVYEKIIKEHETNAEFVAKSLYRTGICYEKLGKSGKAGKAFNKLGNDYAKYLDSIEGASQKVSDTQNPLIEKLNKKVSLRFVNAPIESVLSYLSSACGVNILIDAQALRNIDTRISIFIW